eukprot:Protomagalhaensia_wolfi_Nauph_80__201@NODE_110_length_3640_cov_84_028048_g83_i0_p2_GENE_NODE_110_length_3640_cov_84_028048_g83_i0NODE_110_length_3640_cov_84_028048_g83_i0_p2_ORF_typecomplete_len392_score48_18DMT_YdcZ/PF04657_13/1e19DMT_YdcZ/PF04657_13/3e157TMRDISM_7TM/PF07695_11/2_1e037TMRDISM_7TM/PF07695_11/0_147TMRDISM_7TM/PF07695_11/3_5PMT/PF02366_18/4_5e03PMT/PF02366_18/30PMT/PF02366_18/0_11Hum_adeno_E3A/PF05393_11/64Hum_adeno_E3A/PF05393_11/47_NODE_110_length_3640_cov_84_028048_g83_i0237335
MNHSYLKDSRNHHCSADDLGSFELAPHAEHSFTATHITTDPGDHPHEDGAAPSKLQWLEMLFPLAAGMVTPIVGAMNSTLSDATNSPFLVTLLAYGNAAIITTAWSFATGREPPMREGVKQVKEFMDQKWYNWLVLGAGVLGAFQHMCLTVITGQLGASLFTVGSAFGTIVGSMVLDSTGFAWSKRHGVSKLTLVGCVIVLAGVVVHKHEVFHPEQDDHLTVGAKVGLILATVLQGCSSSIKSSIGGEFSILCGRHRRSTAFSFITGAIVMGLVIAGYHPGLTLAPLGDFSVSWRLFGVFMTIFVVCVLFIFQRRLSGAITFTCLTVGQMLSSTLMDVKGWLGVKQRPFEIWHAVGISIFLIGVALSTYGKMRRRPATPVSKGYSKPDQLP